MPNLAPFSYNTSVRAYMYADGQTADSVINLDYGLRNAHALRYLGVGVKALLFYSDYAECFYVLLFSNYEPVQDEGVMDLRKDGRTEQFCNAAS